MSTGSSMAEPTTSATQLFRKSAPPTSRGSRLPGPTTPTTPPLCAKGEVARAIRLLKQHDERLQDWAAVLEGGMRQLRYSRREGEMLSIIFNHRPPSPFSVQDLLRALISYGDIPGFLKNAHRLGVYRGFETEIEAGIQSRPILDPDIHSGKLSSEDAKGQGSPSGGCVVIQTAIERAGLRASTARRTSASIVL